MAITLETLKTREESIREELRLLKNLAQSQEKEKKQEQVSSNISQLTQDIVKYLETETDAAKKWQAEQLKAALDTVSLELAQLKESVVAGKDTKPEARQDVETNSSEIESKDKQLSKGKGWGESITEFVSESWSDVTSSDKWKEEPGKNLLKVAGFAGTGIGAFLLVKKMRNWLFWDKKEKEASQESDDWGETKKSEKKKGFWDKRYGKTLKWLGIGAGVGTAGYYLGKRFGRWGKDWPWEWADATDGAKDQAINTANLKKENPEKFLKYQGMGANIDSQYDQIMKKELDAGWRGMSIADGYEKFADKTKLSKEDFQATVPMCIDNEFSSVDKLLSEGWYYGYLREKSLVDLKSFLIGKGKDWIGKVMGPYLVNLTSFVPFVGGDWSESLTKWLESGEPAEREAELKLFFRQYAKVINYVQDKRSRLVEKIAEEKLRTVGTEFSTVEDALDDEEWLENHVYSDDRYKNFMGGKLFQSIDVMKGQGLFDDQLSMRMKKQMEAADAQRDELLKTKDGKDALQRLWAVGDTLSPEINREGIQVCKDVAEDLKENFDKDRSYLYFGSSHALINSEQKNIQEFLKESGLWDLKSWILESLKHFEQKFESWSMSAEDIQLYKNQINSYFAMKKEILIWAKAIQQMKADNASITERVLNIGTAIVGDILYHSTQSLKSFKDGNWMTWWLQATLPLTLWGAVISQVGKWKGNKFVEWFWRFIRNSSILSVARNSTGQVLRRTPTKSLNLLPIWLLSRRYDIPRGDQLLFQDIIEGKIRGDKAQRLIQKSNSLWEHGKWLNSLSEFMQKVAGKSDTELPAKQLQVLFNNDAQILFTKNKSLRELFFRLEPIWPWDQTKMLWNGYRQKIYTPSGFHHVEILEKFMAGEAGHSSSFAKLTEKQKRFFEELIYQWKFTKIEDLNALVKNVDKINLDKVELWKISHLAGKLSESLSDFDDMAKLNNKIASVGSESVNDGGKVVDDAVEATTDVLKKSPLGSDLGEQKRLLNVELERLRKLPSKTSVDQARLTKLEQQLTELENFEKQLLNSGEEVVNQASELLTLLKKWKNLNTAIEQLDLLKKLDGLVDANGNKVVSNLDDVIKNLDDTTILSLKGKKLSGVSDDALELLAKTFSEIKIAKNTKKLFANADELLTGIKTMIKVFAKIT